MATTATATCSRRAGRWINVYDHVRLNARPSLIQQSRPAPINNQQLIYAQPSQFEFRNSPSHAHAGVLPTSLSLTQVAPRGYMEDQSTPIPSPRFLERIVPTEDGSRHVVVRNQRQATNSSAQGTTNYPTGHRENEFEQWKRIDEARRSPLSHNQRKTGLSLLSPQPTRPK